MKDFVAPLTAAGIIFGGGAFLYLTIPLEGTRVESVHLIVSGLMGGAATFLFGDAVQRQTAANQPTVTTTTGPPATLTMTPAERQSYDNGDIPAEPYGSTRT